MRKVFVDDLPRRGKFIDWEKSLNYKVKFIYDDIEGEIKIVDYDKTTQKINVKYLNTNNYEIYTCTFLKCIIGKLLNINTKKCDPNFKYSYKYSIGDIVENKTSKIKILKQIQIKFNSSTRNNRIEKGYEYECLNCGNVDTIDESSLKKGVGCNVCCIQSKKIIKGVNDLATTHPYLVKYFLNVKDTYTNTYSSTNKASMICPNCSYVKTMPIQQLYRQGFGCNSCGDGISYANKFMFNVISNLNINFIPEKVFEWAKNKKYDFYIRKYGILVECHGLQHYQNQNRGRSLKEEQENDRLKKELALQNGIKEENYIVIDCRYSDLEWIKNSIMNSKLVELFDFKEKDINWLQCHQFACSSLVKIACDLWNNGTRSPKEISKIMKLNENTIRRYLKQGTKISLCDYDSNIGNKRKVMCLENNMVFESISEIVKNSLNLFNKKLNSGHICDVCKGNRKSTGGYHFKYID